MPHQHVALSSVATQTIRHCVGAGNLISKGSASRLKAGNPARSMDCPRGFFRNPSVTRLLGIRTFLKAATQRMSAHTTAREPPLLFGGLARGPGASSQDLSGVAMKNYQKSNVNTGRPGQTGGGRSQRWVSGAGPAPTNSPNAQRNYERYLALARAEAQSGNTVAAENYYQHAEHYFGSMWSERAK